MFFTISPDASTGSLKWYLNRAFRRHTVAAAHTNVDYLILQNSLP